MINMDKIAYYADETQSTDDVRKISEVMKLRKLFSLMCPFNYRDRRNICPL